MSSKLRLLYVASEINPFLKITEVADFVRTLPQAMQEMGMEIRILVPRFGLINERKNRLHEVVRLSGINIIVDKDDYPLQIKVASLPNARLQVYFMDNEDYFKRKFVFRNEADEFYDDNAERMVFFCKSALETVKKFGWPPHVVHCHGWMTSLVPLYLKTTYKKEPVFAYSKVVYTASPVLFKEKLSANFEQKALISADIKAKDFECFRGSENGDLTLGAAKCADVVIHGGPDLDPAIMEEVKPSRTKKVIPWDESWKEDITPLLDLYKSLTGA